MITKSQADALKPGDKVILYYEALGGSFEIVLTDKNHLQLLIEQHGYKNLKLPGE